MSNVLMASEGLVSSHANLTNNPHGVTKTQVGLGNVDNTSDVDKPVSTATANAIATAVKTAVKTSAQTLTDNEKSQARENIGAQETLPLMDDGQTYGINVRGANEALRSSQAMIALNDSYGHAITSTYAKKSDVTSHTGDRDIHVTAFNKTLWSNHASNVNMHVTADQKATWSAKQDAIAAFLKDAVVNGGVLTITKKDGTTVQFQGGSSAWADITGKPQSFTPTAHASSHATGGSDAVTPASIGAQPTLAADGSDLPGGPYLPISGGDINGDLKIVGEIEFVAGSVTGDTFTINGNQAATEDQLPYPIASATMVSDDVYQLRDRTVNTFDGSGIFIFPAKVGTASRDFSLVISSQSGPPSVSFPTEGVTYVSEQSATELWSADANAINEWFFHENGANQFAVYHRAFSTVTHASS